MARGEKLSERDLRELMSPDTYQPARHRDRRMPPRRPRLTATEKQNR
ncbi:hypothetical protein [Mycolicibacterium vaccae]